MKNEGVLFLFLFIWVSSYCQNDTAMNAADTSYETSKVTLYKRISPERNEGQVYKLKPAIDVPLTLGGSAWTLYAFSKIYGRDTSTTPQVLALDKNDISSINRFGTELYSPKAFNASNDFFYGSMPYPLILLLDKDIRKDALKIGFMWWESLAITGSLYSAAAYIHPKYRPYAYNPETPIERRKRGGAKNSFYAGHVALVANSTFFVAKVFSDYHPNSRLRWVLYSIAGIATSATGYLRVKAGEHFLTDVLIGAGIGTATGILVPQFHKNKTSKRSNLSLVPFVGTENGMTLVVRL